MPRWTKEELEAYERRQNRSDSVAPNAKRKRSKWTTYEIMILTEGYKNPNGVNLELLSKAIGRSWQAVADKAWDLGITSGRGEHKRREETLERSSVSQLKRCESEEELQRRSKVQKEWIARDGHPRGMLGKKHTQEAKDLISAKNTGCYVPGERILRRLKTREARGIRPPQRGSWKAGWREIGGKRIFARSAWEANYARYLQFLTIANEIQGWEHEPKTFWFEGIKRGCCSYLPDFSVTLKNGIVEYREVKGWMDPASKTKIRRFRKYFPTLNLMVIDRVWFKSNARQLSGLIHGWE